MPLPDRLARFNRRVTNPLARTYAGRLPGLAVVVHRGRVTGREYRTPVNAFVRDSGFVIPLSYGAERDWVKNVVAAGDCTIRRRGRGVVATDPRVIRGTDAIRLVPRPIRPVLRMLRVDEVLQLRQSEGRSDGA